MPSFRDGNETLLASVLYQHLGNTYSEILINILINLWILWIKFLMPQELAVL